MTKRDIERRIDDLDGDETVPEFELRELSIEEKEELEEMLTPPVDDEVDEFFEELNGRYPKNDD